MNILVANDDGIEAKGIRELVKALSEIATIYVCAPHTQRSASGHGITVSRPITAEEVAFENAAMALSLSGTPADCIKLGMKILEQKSIKADMVFSGINHGGNLGTDTLYSGTVSAAIEGSICGVPSVAVSVDSHQAEHFAYACKLAREAFDWCRKYGTPDTVLNINTPNLPEKEIKGLKFTTLGRREYKEFFAPVELEDGRTGYRYSGDPVVYEGLPDTIDVIAMQDGYASITPLHRDLTDYRSLDKIKKWRIGK
ncbi:MAG: 5'/3'-nucleotidase SurE [Bacillota bacterium]|nr:5'/3'-nucleotidase SurE [Bacillota bacterium]